MLIYSLVQSSSIWIFHHSDTSQSIWVSPSILLLLRQWTRVQCHFCQLVRKSKRNLSLPPPITVYSPDDLISLEGWSCPPPTSAGDSSVRSYGKQSQEKSFSHPTPSLQHADPLCTSVLLQHLVEKVECAFRWQKNKDGAQPTRSPLTNPLLKRRRCTSSIAILWEGSSQGRGRDRQWKADTRNGYAGNTDCKYHCILLGNLELQYFM